MNCELCAGPIEDQEVELISYYDLCDLGLALGYSISLPLDETDISEVIPGCTSIPWPEQGAGSNLATWKVCTACHDRISRRLKGRTEYPPRHY